MITNERLKFIVDFADSCPRHELVNMSYRVGMARELLDLRECIATLEPNLQEAVNTILRLKSRIAELEAAQRWIPVEEMLPEMSHFGSRFSDMVLIVNGGDCYVSSYCDKLKSWTHPEYTLDNVTHWMPLPKLPVVNNEQ